MSAALQRRLRRLVGSVIVLAGTVIFAADMGSLAMAHPGRAGTVLSSN